MSVRCKVKSVGMLGQARFRQLECQVREGQVNWNVRTGKVRATGMLGLECFTNSRI